MAEADQPEFGPPEPPAEGGLFKPFLEHLEDLRWTLIKCAIAVAVFLVLSLCFIRELIAVLEWPLIRAGLCTDPSKFLISYGVVDSFTLAFKVGLYGGLLGALPLVLFFLGQFILPALTRREKQYLWPAFSAGAIMFLLGVACCYWLLLPKTLQISFEFSNYLGFQAMWTIHSYLAFVLQFCIGMGIAFELPVLLLVLVKLGILSTDALRRFRRYAIVLIFIAAAAITPTTDVITLTLVAVPMCLLYEACIWIGRAMERRRAAAEEIA